MAAAVLLVDESTTEGDRMRRLIDVPLVRSRAPFFDLTWTAMHRIDENSPFFGPEAPARLQAQSAEILLILSGIDVAMAQSVHARHYYRLADIVWQARYADVLSQRPDGTRRIDYRRFHEVEPLTRPKDAPRS